MNGNTGFYNINSFIEYFYIAFKNIFCKNQLNKSKIHSNGINAVIGSREIQIIWDNLSNFLTQNVGICCL